MKPTSLAVVAALALCQSPTLGADIQTLPTGSTLPPFELPGTDGNSHSQDDYAEADILAILFTCNHCPTAQAYEERVKNLVTDYAAKSFQLVAVSPNDPQAVRLDELGYSIHNDTLEGMKAHAKTYGFNFPYLYDGESQAFSKAMGVQATPHLFVFNKDRHLQYSGRIDDSESGREIKSHDARSAIDALLAGQPVPVSETRAFGCSTKWASKRDARAEADMAWQKRPVTLERAGPDALQKLAQGPPEGTGLRLINLWATWCGPCLTEMPDLVEVNRQFESRGFDLVTISLDDPSMEAAALKKLAQLHVTHSASTAADILDPEGRSTSNFLYDATDKDALAQAIDPEWPGALPHSILIAPGGEVVYRKTGAIDPHELRGAIVGHLGRTYGK
ncbi:hypothetical protein BH23VER1_BH23VER1_25110 [soil metagenome]